MRFPFLRRRQAGKKTQLRHFAEGHETARFHQIHQSEEGDDDMAEGFHVPYGKLSEKTRTMHYAISSLMEELEAVDWYAQRADDCEDTALRDILLHNMREEVEHAIMTLEWLRRNDATFAKEMKEYLFTEGDILEQEEEAMGRNSEQV